MVATAGHLATEAAGGDAPVVLAVAVGHAEAARHAEGVGGHRLGDVVVVLGRRQLLQAVGLLELAGLQRVAIAEPVFEIGRASCRERVCLYVSFPVVALSYQKKDSTPTYLRPYYNS